MIHGNQIVIAIVAAATIVSALIAYELYNQLLIFNDTIDAREKWKIDEEVDIFSGYSAKFRTPYKWFDHEYSKITGTPNNVLACWKCSLSGWSSSNTNNCNMIWQLKVAKCESKIIMKAIFFVDVLQVRLFSIDMCCGNKCREITSVTDGRYTDPERDKYITLSSRSCNFMAPNGNIFPHYWLDKSNTQEVFNLGHG